MKQNYCLERLGYTEVIVQEYDKVIGEEEVVRSAQTTINSLCDYTRDRINGAMDEFKGDLKSFYAVAGKVV